MKSEIENGLREVEHRPPSIQRAFPRYATFSSHHSDLTWNGPSLPAPEWFRTRPLPTSQECTGAMCYPDSGRRLRQTVMESSVGSGFERIAGKRRLKTIGHSAWLVKWNNGNFSFHDQWFFFIVIHFWISQWIQKTPWDDDCCGFFMNCWMGSGRERQGRRSDAPSEVGVWNVTTAQGSEA